MLRIKMECYFDLCIFAIQRSSRDDKVSTHFDRGHGTPTINVNKFGQSIAIVTVQDLVMGT